MADKKKLPVKPATKAAPAKGKGLIVKGLVAYCVKTKEKNVPVQDPEIHKNSRGGYMVKGHDGNGNTLTAMISEDTAKAGIKGGAKKAY